MAHCPYCQEEVSEPEGDVLRMDESFNEEAEDVDVSVQQHIQLKCPGCTVGKSKPGRRSRTILAFHCR